jgi:hypothetical protein
MADEASESAPCMLTLAHAGDFVSLAARLILSRKFLRGAKPRTVVVFDNHTESKAFCERHGQQGLCEEFVRLHLSELLGQEQYELTKRLFQQNARGGARLEFNNQTGRASRRCDDKGAGRTYQALKKFYGVARGPEECSAYWVSDAESFPFRPYHFQQQMRRVRGRELVAVWHRNTELSCSGFLQSSGFLQLDWNVPPCQAMIAQQLGLRGASISNWAEYAQQMSYTDQFWIYQPRVARQMIAVVEQAMGLPFARVWMGWGMSDDGFYHLFLMHLHGLATQRGVLPPQPISNLPEELRLAMPDAAARCCGCEPAVAVVNESATAGQTPTAAHLSYREPAAPFGGVHRVRGEPCRLISHLWSSCMMTQAGPRAIASFLADRLGVFGLWMEMVKPPPAVLEANDGLSWCVNNCFNRGVLHLLRAVRGVDVPGLLAEHPDVRAAFALNKQHGR